MAWLGLGEWGPSSPTALPPLWMPFPDPLQSLFPARLLAHSDRREQILMEVTRQCLALTPLADPHRDAGHMCLFPGNPAVGASLLDAHLLRGAHPLPWGEASFL